MFAIVIVIAGDLIPDNWVGDHRDLINCFYATDHKYGQISLDVLYNTIAADVLQTIHKIKSKSKPWLR